MSDPSTDTQQTTPTEYNFHPQFYQTLNIPPCPITRTEMAHRLHHYLVTSSALVCSEDKREQYILITEGVSRLTGFVVGDSFVIREDGQDRRSYTDFIRIVFRHVHLR